MNRDQAVRDACAIGVGEFLPAKECAECGWDDSQVVESRPTSSGQLRRRRVCKNCGARWTTLEVRAKWVGKAATLRAAALAQIGGDE